MRADFAAALDDLCGEGFRIDVIWPADDPHGALLSRDGEAVRLVARAGGSEPDGTLPPFDPQFILTRAGGGSADGRAGMGYRDLIPGRLGGRYIASHITITEGGPVADWVHYHRVAFQMIFVARGWVRVVYEDQGEPFVMQAGDLVLQAPEIRHRVLESSDGLEVIEIGCPALHATFADHEMALPTFRIDRDRDFSGQRFLRHVAAEAQWTPFHGADAQQTGMAEATDGLADVRIIRAVDASDLKMPGHDGELAFAFILNGSATLDRDDGHALRGGDCFVIPPGEAWRLSLMSADLRLLHVTTATSA